MPEAARESSIAEHPRARALAGAQARAVRTASEHSRELHLTNLSRLCRGVKLGMRGAQHLVAQSALLLAVAVVAQHRRDGSSGESSNSGSTSPVLLTPSLFRATGATQRANSSWGVATTHAPRPENFRSTTFWGRFVSEPCASKVWGFTESHALPTYSSAASLGYLPGSPATASSGSGFYPQCGAVFGPSFEANIFEPDGTPSHLVRTQASDAGPFAQYSNHGQNPSGVNKYIAATYTDFNPKWNADVPNRMRPWGATSSSSSSANSSELRAVVRATQSVTIAALSEPAVQQLQQDLNLCFINERCNRTTSRSFCQIVFNVKTFIAGVHAYKPSSDATAFNDGGQGGLIAVVGPINVNGQPTSFHNATGVQQTAWTSRGSATQSVGFSRRAFAVEISWAQFQTVLLSVTGGDPGPTFGEAGEWAVPGNWVLLRAGYGQENYNNGTGMSVIEGRFEGLEVASLISNDNTRDTPADDRLVQ